MRSRLVRRLAGFALVFALLGSHLWTTLSARAEAAEPTDYRPLFDAAQAEYGAGHYLAARALFGDAHERLPSARTLRGLGMSELALQNHRSSVDYLERALASEEQALDARLRRETEALLERAYGGVARLMISSEPAEAQLSIDGKPVARNGEKLVLEAGEHRLELSMPGYTRELRTIQVRGREYEIWHVALEPERQGAAEAEPLAPLPSEVARASAPPQRAPEPLLIERPSRQPLYKNAWLWSGVGVALVASAVVLSVLLRPEPRVVTADPIATDHTVVRIEGLTLAR